jgi:hypothetical protein
MSLHDLLERHHVRQFWTARVAPGTIRGLFFED